MVYALDGDAQIEADGGLKSDVSLGYHGGLD
jgi:hypothetical protein